MLNNTHSSVTMIKNELISIVVSNLSFFLIGYIITIESKP